MIEKLNEIENLMYEVSEEKVMFDSDIDKLFDYETKNLNR